MPRLDRQQGVVAVIDGPQCRCVQWLLERIDANFAAQSDPYNWSLTVNGFAEIAVNGKAAGRADGSANVHAWAPD